MTNHGTQIAVSGRDVPIDGTVVARYLFELAKPQQKALLISDVEWFVAEHVVFSIAGWFVERDTSHFVTVGDTHTGYSTVKSFLISHNWER